MRIIAFPVLLLFSTMVTGQTTVSAKLDSLFARRFTAGEPGGAVLIVQRGNVIYKRGFGVADIEGREPITSQTLFNLGSISKTFVAYGILSLAARNKLSLDDNLLKYFPDFISSELAAKVKIHHLLTHTSGLPDSRKVNEERQFYLVADDSGNFAPLLSTRELEFEPGTAYHYSNPAFNGLALIIAKVTGRKWQSYIREAIFDPAGMARSTITDGSHPSSGVAHAYVENAGGGFDELDYGEEPTFAAAGNGGVWSSVEELWKYEQAIQQHSFLDAVWIDSSRTVFPQPHWKDSAGSRLGLSWFITRESGREMIGHTGSQGGFVSDYCWLPSEQLFYVLLCNIPRPVKDIRKEVFSVLMTQ